MAPTFVKENIEILQETFDIGNAEWTIFAETVVLKNCEIGWKNHTQPALHIGRLAIHWDSLTAPTIDMEVQSNVIFPETPSSAPW